MVNSKKGEVGYVDGIRGIAAFLVFFHHFLLVFFTSFYTSDIAASHLHGLEIKYGKSLFSVFSNGDFCVQIFFVLSGFVLSRKYFRTGNLEVAISGMHRRFIRLYVPVAFTLILAYILLKTGAFLNKPVSAITHSEWWFGGMWDMANPFERLLTCLSYSTMFQSDNVFDTSLWTLAPEFLGSLFIFSFLVFTHFTRYRLLFLCLSLLYFCVTNNPFFAAFVLGMSLCYIERLIERIENIYMYLFSIIFFIIALVLGSYPATNVRAGTFFEPFGHALLGYYYSIPTLGAYLLVLSFVMSRPFQRVGGLRVFRFLGKVSFSLYLLHPLLLGSFSCWLFLLLYNHLGYNVSVLIVFLFTIPLLIFTSWLVTKYVDEKGIILAKRFYEFLKAKAAPLASDPIDGLPKKE